MIAGHYRHALVERTEGPALCGYVVPAGTRWLHHGFTCWNLDRIGCLPCRDRAAAVLGGTSVAA